MSEEKKLTDNRAYDLIVEFDEMGFEPTTLPPQDMSAEEYAAMWKAEMLKEIYRLQNDIVEKEIELQTARNAINERDEWCVEQKAEIERLTEKDKRNVDIIHTANLDDYLLKSVEQQDVKDTAKEIFEKLLGYIGSQQQFCIVDEEHKTLIDCDKLFDFVGNLAKEKGVEVENG